MSMLAIWICELSVLVQDSCGAKTVLGYFHCIWSRLGIIGQFLKEALYFLCSSLMTSIIIMTPFMRAVGVGVVTWQYSGNYCLCNECGGTKFLLHPCLDDSRGGAA